MRRLISRIAKSGWAETNLRNSAFGITRNFEFSSVITDAERGPSSSTISPKYSPGPCTFSSTSLPSLPCRNTLTRPDTMMKIESLRSPSLMMIEFFGNACCVACSASARSSSSSRPAAAVLPDRFASPITHHPSPTSRLAPGQHVQRPFVRVLDPANHYLHESTGECRLERFARLLKRVRGDFDQHQRRARPDGGRTHRALLVEIGQFAEAFARAKTVQRHTFP